MRITESRLRQFIREELAKPESLDDQGLDRLNQLLDDADSHPEFAGLNLVKGPEKDAARFVILDDSGNPVGFMTPRFDRGYWRAGAIYVDPSARGKGYARKAISEFFDDPSHLPARVWIADINKESQKAFIAAGFWQGERRDLSALPEDKGRHYYKDAMP